MNNRPRFRCCPGFGGLAVTLAMVVVLAAAAPAWGESASQERDGDLLFSEEFDFKTGGRLIVDVDDMDIRVKTGSGGMAGVEVFASGRNKGKAREWFEKSHFEARLDGSQLVIENRDPRSNNFGFGNWFSDFSVVAVVNIPSETSLDIRTEDGDVRIDDIKGDAQVHTDDGDLEISDVRGRVIEISSEDGDVRAGLLEADEVTVSTDDGDLDIDRIDGKRVQLSSSDGDIVVSRIGGTEMSIESDDGDVEITASGTRLEARCADGDVTVTLLSEMEVDIKTDDGDIEINIPQGTNADIDLRGGHVSVRDIAIKGTVSDDSIKGSINNGGALIRVRADDGSIRIRES